MMWANHRKNNSGLTKRPTSARIDESRYLVHYKGTDYIISLTDGWWKIYRRGQTPALLEAIEDDDHGKEIAIYWIETNM